MTTFLTYYNLCPIPERTNFLGIAADKDEGNIITTLDRNIVIIMKILTQKQIRSWSVVEKLSSKVVYDRRTEKYVGVFANKFIRCWDENTTNINKCKKLKFHKNIAELICDKNDTLVLYADGSCEPLSVAIKSRKDESATYNSQQLELFSSITFSNASVHYLSNGNRILTYFERNIKTGDHHLVRICLQGEESNIKRFNLKRGVLNVKVAGAAVIEGDGVPVLLTIWTDKRMFLLSLADETETERSPGSFVSMLTQLKVDTPLSILGISKHFVAIYGANHGHEGASLLLYNTQYKVIKTKQFFKVYFDFSQLWSIDEYILLAMGQILSVVKYRVLKEVLSDLVGTQIGHDYQAAVEDSHINEEDYLEECLQYSTESQSLADAKKLTKRNEKIDIKEADGSTVAFLNTINFDKELNSLKQLSLCVDVVPVNEPLDDFKISLMSNYNDNGFVCPEIQIIAKQLEKAGTSEHEITEKLLTVLMKANLLQDIGICLRRYNNISEKILSKALKFLLQSLDTKTERQKISSVKNEVNETIIDTENNFTITNGINKEHMDVDCQPENPNDTTPFPNLDLLEEKRPETTDPHDVKNILNILLSCSFDADAMVVHIRRDIEYEHVLFMLQYLLDMLERPQISLVDERPSLDHCSSDYELQLLRWFGVFLNSHFQKLALSKDVELIEILFKWHQLFESYQQEIFDLQKVAALLYNTVERKKTFKQTNSSKWYSIEEVYLF